MFSPKGLFNNLPCPDATGSTCSRNPCPFSHKPLAQLDLLPSPLSALISTKPNAVDSASSKTNAAASTSKEGDQGGWTTVTRKRQAAELSSASGQAQPPKKLQRVSSDATKKPIPSKPISTNSSGAPTLRINAAHSSVPIPVRQTMLTTLYDHFRTLYLPILKLDPSLPAAHALAQENELYLKSNKHTYRNTIITTIAAIKRRSPPDTITHASVGTEAELAKRKAELASLSAFRLLPSHLEPVLMTEEQMKVYDYITEIPEGVGGDNPNQVGNLINCERCGSPFQVAEVPTENECTYHWGRPYTTKANGIKETLYRCCSQQSGSPGCETGAHVFYEKSPQALHSRHAFSPSSDSCADPHSATLLDVIAMDCEMIYTTCGMSVARVSLVDGKGDTVFDELVRMSEGVHVLDLNTRFSGVTSLDDAVFDLAHIRAALGSYIGPKTILIGHALENDLKTLRMIHPRVVDTCVLYPHKLGPPYRRALRDLARDHLGKFIQEGGGTVGHSSLEDSRATLDLVRRWAMEQTERDKDKKKHV